MSTLIVPLPTGNAPSTAEWPYVLTHDGRSMAQHGEAPAALLPAPGRPAEVVAVVPVSALSWHPVVLPPGTRANSPRLQALLEGLLEDRLLAAPHELHLALGPAGAQGAVRWVAACDRTWLLAGLQALEQAGRPVTRIVPECWPVADAPALRAVGPPEQARWLVSTSHAQAPVLSCPLTPATTAWLKASDPTLPVLAEPAVAALAEQAMGRSVTLETAAERWLAAARSPWDLAQHQLARSGRHRAAQRLTRGLQELLHAPAWRPLRWGLAALVVAQIGGLNAWAWKDRQALAQRQQAIRQVLTQTFPSVPVVVDAPLQMRREIHALRQASGMASGQDLETLLGAAAAALPADRAPTAIDFTPGELRLKGLNLQGSALDDAQARLQAGGFSVRQEGDVTLVHQETR